jgi:hypothetical protein
MSARHEAFLLGLTLRNLENKLSRAEEEGHVGAAEVRQIRADLARGKRRVAELEKQAEQESEEELERQVQRLEDFLADTSDINDEDYEDLVSQYNEAQTLLDSIRYEREQARRRKVPKGPKRGARLLASMRQQTTRKSMSSGAGERWIICIDCGGWLDRDSNHVP